MKFISLILMIMIVLTSSVSMAQQAPLEKAYSLYYEGETEAAIELMEDFVRDNPDPGALYFLGYAYYELQDMEKAGEYFNRAFKAESFYSPMEEEKK
jgi:tetratricopeptide (TPR) repeat protein